MSSTQVDLFAKVRGHERELQLRAARDADLLPYFRLLDGIADRAAAFGFAVDDHQ